MPSTAMPIHGTTKLILNNVAAIRQAMRNYIKVKEGSHFTMAEDFDLSYAIKSEYIPAMRKIDIETIDSKLEPYSNPSTLYTYAMLTEYTTDIYNYLKSIKTGWDFYFFRVGAGSQLRDQIYAEIKTQNPLLFLEDTDVDIKDNVASLYRRVDKLHAKKYALEVECLNHKNLLQAGQSAITNLTAQCEKLQKINRSGGNSFALDAEMKKLREDFRIAANDAHKHVIHIGQLNAKIAELQSELKSKDDMIKRLLARLAKVQSAEIQPAERSESIELSVKKSA